MPDVKQLVEKEGWTPSGRHSVRRGNRVLATTRSCPWFYKDRKGALKPVSLDIEDTVTRHKNKMKLRPKGIASVGVSGQADNYLGLRPEGTDGEEQLEFNVTKIVIDGAEIPIDISKSEVISPNAIDMGNVVVYSHRNGTRQMVKAPNEFSDFRVTYTVDMVGLTPSGATVSGATVRDAYNFALKDVGGGAGADIIKKIKYGTTNPTLKIGYVDDRHFIMSDTYGFDDEFYGPLEGFTTSDIKHPGSSMYLENNIVMMLVGKDVKKGHANLLLNAVRRVLNATIEDNYFIVSGKKVGGFAWTKENKFFVEINTADITKIAPLFKRKDFKATGFVKIMLNEFVEELTAMLESTPFNAIADAGELINPMPNGEFRIEDADGNFKFRIARPLLLDANFECVKANTTHTLKHLHDGVYEYTKLLRSPADTSNVAYIDGDIYYSSTDDGDLYYGNEVWDTAHDATDATTWDPSSTLIEVGIVHGGKPTKYHFYRGAVMFDTSAISGSVLAADCNLYITNEVGDVTLVVCPGTYSGTPTTADFDSYTISNKGTGTVTGTGAYLTISITDTSIIDTAGTTELMILDKDHDFDDVAIEADNYALFSSADETGTSQDPYLEITEGVAGPTNKAYYFT